MINKIEENYFVENDIEISKNNFIEFISTKFSNYTPYIALKKNKKTKIDIIINLLFSALFSIKNPP